MRYTRQLSAKKLSMLLTSLYEAAADSSQWPTFLHDVNVELGAERSSILIHRYSSPTASRNSASQMYESGFDPDSVRLYNQHYGSRDLYANGFFRRKIKAELGYCSDLVDHNALRNSEFYNDYLKRFNIFYLCWIALARPGGSIALSFVRSEKKKPFEPTELSVLSLITPHVKQAFFLSAELQALRSRTKTSMRTVSAFDIAVASVNAKGQVVEVSPALESLMRRGDEIRLKDGRLRARDVTQQGKLDLLLRSATQSFSAPSLEATSEAGNSLHAVCLTSSDKKNLPIVAVPFRCEGLLQDDSPTALVFFGISTTEVSALATVLKQLYGLSASESRLAEKLWQGLNLQVAADELQVTRETVRDRLKVIFQKTDTSRQAELVCLLNRLPKR